MKFLMKKFKKNYQHIRIFLYIWVLLKIIIKNNDRTTQKIRISAKET